MLSTATDVGSAPKRKIANTYGKNRNRNAVPGTSEGASSTKPTSSKPTSLSRPKLKGENASARTSTTVPSPDDEEGDPYDFPDDAAAPVVKKHSSYRSVAKPAQSAATTSGSSLDPRTTMKRKPTHPPSARLPKKQRSSSPEVLSESSHSPKPSVADRQPQLSSKLIKGSARSLQSDTAARSSSSSSTTEGGKQRSIPIRPTRTLEKPVLKTQKNPPVDFHLLDAIGPTTEATIGERTTQRRSPEKQPRPMLKKDTVSYSSASHAGTAKLQRPTQSVTRKNVSSPDISTTTTPPAKRRPRLIDTLKAQAENNSSSSSDEDENGFRETPRSRSREHVHDFKASQTSSPQPSQHSETPRARTLTRHGSMPKKPGLKYTYSQQRTMLADDSMLDGLDPLKAEELAFSQPLLAPSEPQASAYDFDDGLVEDAAASGAVRGIHELRRAGANNRTTDEMNDILDRIGVPSAKASSVRRSALLEMATQVQDKTFRRQFLIHDNGTTSLLKGIGTETDPIAAYLITAILTTLLATATSSHLSRQLQLEDLAKVMGLLLIYENDIAVLAKDRKSNLSKFTQNTLMRVKDSLLQMKIWEPSTSLSQLSPRTLALMCMHQIQQQTPVEELLTADLTAQLFEILAAPAERREALSWHSPGQAEPMDMFLVLSILVAYSPEVMQSEAAGVWNMKHLPTIASVLETSLSQRIDQLGDLEILILQLTLNTSNGNQAGQTILLEKGLLRNLAQAAHTMFDSVLQSITNNTFAKPVIDTLTILLGLMINLSEHYELAGTTLKDFEPFDQLVSFFHGYSSRTQEAKEKASLNVAFGYLAVLLGCLCRHRPTRKRFEALNLSKTIRPLISAIQEFAKHLETTHAKFGVEGDPNALSQIERLRILIDELEGI
ncbi:hypothetical protein PpBr36_07387 [Pyricularia pennisetigena]|uniref:hypothetical protein n=1 Tax=Pyricularia pennisetigena TaxID=1578925 RepID=UPI00114F0C5C|nr:hypothetical protein PpBr36_07387 [Pyricularia pennisetigena]TLS25504.1 hypothetical protein PpBr36_07387 [Pyricularia pennisetigena]